MCLHKRLCVYSSLIYFLLQTTWILLFYIMALQLPVVETYVMYYENIGGVMALEQKLNTNYAFL